MSDVKIIIPEQVMDEISDNLVMLTREIDKRDPKRTAHGLLGGEHGYGAEWENGVFMMHPYCWCDGEDCAWCCGCKCEPPAEQYVDGQRVVSWWEATKDMVPDYPHNTAKYGTPAYKEAEDRFYAAIKARDARVKVIYSEIRHTCGHGWALNRERGKHYGPEQRAPNFWHKPSGLRVWWYKYVGRDQDALNAPESIDTLNAIFRECIASLAE
jgi:hypothetical protein